MPNQNCPNHDKCYYYDDHQSNKECDFCLSIMQKILAKESFFVQFPIFYSNKSRKIDFAFVTGEGRKVAIELDGSSHWGNEDNYRESIKRQNELTLLGWHILRFTNEQFPTEPQYCLDSIKEFIGSDVTGVHPPKCVYKEIDAKLWSKKQHKNWFIDDFDIQKYIIHWTWCPERGCSGRAKQNGNLFVCDTCGVRFAWCKVKGCTGRIMQRDNEWVCNDCDVTYVTAEIANDDDNK